MGKWSDVKPGDIIYTITPASSDGDSQVQEYVVKNITDNDLCNQYCIIVNCNNMDYKLFITYSNNDKTNILTYLHDIDKNAHQVLVGLDKKQLYIKYLYDLNNCYTHVLSVYNEAYKSCINIQKRIEKWENELSRL